MNGEVTAVDIDSRGRLAFTLGGATVWCGSDPDYEAWSYDGPQGEKVVCTPGGGPGYLERRPGSSYPIVLNLP